MSKLTVCLYERQGRIYPAFICRFFLTETRQEDRMGLLLSSLFKHEIAQIILLLTTLFQIQFYSSDFSSFHEFRLLINNTIV